MAVTYIYAPYGLQAVTITQEWLANICVTAVFVSLGSFMLFLRAMTVLIRHRPFGREDWAIYLAYLASIGYTVSSVISVRWGVGLRTEEVPPHWNVNAMKATYAVEIFYYFSIFLVKMSILFMYLSIGRGLGSGDRFCRYTRWTIALVAVHFLTTMVVTGVQCIPMSRYWSGAGEGGFCINIAYFFYSTNIFTIVSDVLILALPVPTLWELQMPLKKKIGLIAIFGIGVITTIASGIRLLSVGRFQGVTGGDGLQSAAPINTWSYIEIYLGITCASIPAIQSLFHRTKHSSRSHTSATPSSTGKRSKASTITTKQPKDSVLATTTISQTSTRKPSYPPHDNTTADDDEDEYGDHVSLEHLTPKGVTKSPSQTALRSAESYASPRSVSRATDLSYFSNNGTVSPFGGNGGGPTREVREGV